MTWLKEVWGSLFHDQPESEGRDIDRIWEMLEYLKDVPYDPAPHHPMR